MKEPAYRAVLVRSCDVILASRNDTKRSVEARALTTIEIVNRDERQGYVFRNLRGCAEVLQADQQGRRLAILPGTTVFVPRGAAKRNANPVRRRAAAKSCGSSVRPLPPLVSRSFPDRYPDSPRSL